ncbi:MAG: hypothetical protein ACRC7O_18860 [Fimbriiglobus sp.]
MAYGDFTLTGIEATFGITARYEPLFVVVPPQPAPDWLTRSNSPAGCGCRWRRRKCGGS